MLLRQLKHITFRTNIANILKIKNTISTQLIKKRHQQILKKQVGTSLDNYPKTFQDKALILNSPKTIQLLEVVQFGVKYKKSNNWFPILLVIAALSGYILDKMLPVRVSDRYFMISPETSTYLCGYLFSAINFQQPFYLYLPVFYSIAHISKFIKVAHLSYLLMINMVVGGILGQQIVDKRIQSYQVWNNEHLCHGQGCLLSFLFAFCTALGPINSFTHLKSKIGLKTIPGLGVVKKGLPVGMLALFYVIQNCGAAYFEKTRDYQVLASDIATGIIFGIFLRKFKPII